MPLPGELCAYILLQACHEPASRVCTLRDVVDACHIPSHKPFPAACVECHVDMVLTVMQLNRAYYAMGSELLYRSVVLHKPSQLSAFLHTLVHRPALGRFVRHLYIGNTAYLTECPVAYLSTGFSSVEQAFGIEKHRCLDHPCTPQGSVLPLALEHDIAEVATLYAGPCDERGLCIREPGYDFSGQFISKSEWAKRLCEAHSLLLWLRYLAHEERAYEVQRWQAHPFHVEERWLALSEEHTEARHQIDAYLEEKENVQDVFGPRALHLRPVGTRADPMDWGDATQSVDALPDAQDPVPTTLTWHILRTFHDSSMPPWLCVLLAKALAYGRSAALESMLDRVPLPTHSHPVVAYQPAAPFFSHDRFDDVYMYAVSGAMHFIGIGDRILHVPHDATEEADMPHETSTALLASWERRPFGVALRDLRVPTAYDAPEHVPVSVPTLGTLIQNVHALLGLVPRLESLGLSGVLERAIAGSRQCVQLEHVQRLYLGPPPIFWEHTLLWGDPHHKTFANIKCLEVSGCMLLPIEAEALGGANDALPLLREVTWSLYRATLDYDVRSIVTTVALILGLSIPGAVPAPPVQQRRKGVQRLVVRMHRQAHNEVVAAVPAHVLHDTRLSIEIVQAHGPIHPVVQAWHASIKGHQPHDSI